MADEVGLARVLRDGVRADSELVGAKVVTDDGKMLGWITEIFIRTDPMQAIYRVTKSVWQQLFGGGFYLIGNTVRAYSHAGARLIVPANAEQQHTYRSLADSIRACKRELTTAMRS